MEQRTVLALSLTFALLMFYQIIMSLYYPPSQEEVVARPSAGSVVNPPGVEGVAAKVLPIDATPTPASVARGSVPAPAPAISYRNTLVAGRISPLGGRLVGLDFLNYLDKPGKDGVPTRHFSELGEHYFVGETGYMPISGEPFPNAQTPWTFDAARSVPDRGLFVLTWDNGKQLTFEKQFRFDPGTYLFRVVDRVHNRSASPVVFHPYAQLVRVEPKPENSAIGDTEFYGPMGLLDGTRVTHTYEDLRAKDFVQEAAGGWIGFSDMYFLSAIVPSPDGKKKFYFDHSPPAVRVGGVAPKVTLEAGSAEEYVHQFYVGPKEHQALEALQLNLERAIDYGWFHFLAVPLLQLLLFFYKLVPNFGFAIILLTVFVKLLFFPLANKSYRSMNEMKKLQPKMEQLKKDYGDDRQQFNQEMMRLYQEHKVNPLGGCLPILVQIPVFFALYKVLYLSLEMRHAPFVFWIQDLSGMDPYYVLPLLMGASMWYQSKLNPAPPDPVQAKMMSFLPIIFTVMFLQFASGLVLYWLVNNLLSIAQQSYIMKKNAA